MSSRVEEADLLRGFAILAVVAVHVCGNFADMTKANWLLWTAVSLQMFSRLAVPLFLLISGFVLVKRYYGPFSARSFYQKRLQVLLGPYLIFSCVYILIYGFLKGWPTPFEIGKKLWMGSAAEHLWFFRLIFQLYLIYPFLAFAYGRAEEKNAEGWFLLLALALQVFAGWVPAEGDLRVFLLTAPQFWFYFILGMWAGRRFEDRQGPLDLLLDRYAWLLALATAAMTLAVASLVVANIQKYGSFQSIPKKSLVAAIFVEPALFTTAFLLCHRAAALLARQRGFFYAAGLALGRYSYGIFLIHLIFLGGVVKVLRHFSVTADTFLFYPLLFFGTLALSYPAVWAIHRTPFSAPAIGLPRHGTTEPR